MGNANKVGCQNPGSSLFSVGEATQLQGSSPKLQRNSKLQISNAAKAGAGLRRNQEAAKTAERDHGIHEMHEKGGRHGPETRFLGRFHFLPTEPMEPITFL
jgi:hypothetical protein